MPAGLGRMTTHDGFYTEQTDKSHVNGLFTVSYALNGSFTVNVLFLHIGPGFLWSMVIL